MSSFKEWNDICLLGPSRRLSGRTLGPSWGLVGRFDAILDRRGATLGHLDAHLDRLGNLFEPSWGSVEALEAPAVR